MKKFLVLLLFSAVALVSCEKFYSTSKGKPVTFNTSIPAGDSLIISCSECSLKGDELLWGDGLHHFYAVSPSGEITGNVATINIPSTQNAGTKGFKVAAAEAIRGPEPVVLSFQPVSTTLEFVVGPGDYADVEVSGFRLESAGGVLAGKFTATLTPEKAPAIIIDFASTSPEITVETGTVSLRAGDTMKITVTAMPQDLTNLTAYFTVDGEERALSLVDSSGFPMVFPACQKATITAIGFFAPEQEGLFQVRIQGQDVEDIEITYYIL